MVRCTESFFTNHLVIDHDQGSFAQRGQGGGCRAWADASHPAGMKLGRCYRDE